MPLFERTAKGMIPTVFGEIVVRRARAIAAELYGIDFDARSMRGASAGRLAVGMSPAITWPVPQAVARLRAEIPRLDIHIREDMRAALLPALRAGELDLVLAPLPPEGPGEGLVDEVLFYNRISVVARWEHPLARRRRISVTDLLDYDWVLPPADLPPRVQLESAFHQARASPPRHVLEISSVRIMREIVLCTDYLTIMVRDAMRHDQGRKALRVLDVPLSLPMRPMAIVTRQRSEPTQAIKRLIAVMKEEIALEEGASGSVPLF